MNVTVLPVPPQRLSLQRGQLLIPAHCCVFVLPVGTRGLELLPPDIPFLESVVITKPGIGVIMDYELPIPIG